MELETFDCEICNESFNSEQELQEHTRSTHSVDANDINRATAQATDEDEEAAA